MLKTASGSAHAGRCFSVENVAAADISSVGLRASLLSCHRASCSIPSASDAVVGDSIAVRCVSSCGGRLYRSVSCLANAVLSCAELLLAWLLLLLLLSATLHSSSHGVFLESEEGRV